MSRGPSATQRTEPSMRVGDPAVEPEVDRLAQDEVAEADALDPAADGGIEPHGGRRRGPSTGRSGGRDARRPGEHERVEDELRRHVAGEQLGRARRAFARNAAADPGAIAGRDRAQLIEQDRVVDRPGAAGPDQHEVARDVGPQAEQDLDAAPPLGRRDRWPGPASSSVGGIGVVVGAAPAGRPGSDRPRRRPARAGASVVARRPPGRRGPRAAASAMRARDRRPGRGQAGRRPGIGQVEQDARQLGADEDRRRAPGRRPARDPAGRRPAGRAAPRSADRPGRGRRGSPRCRAPRRARGGARKQRDRTVGRRRASWSAQSTIVTPAGGSSRVLSRADWASSFIRSAPSMIATRAPPSTGISGSSPMRSVTPRYFASGPPMTTWRPGPAGPRRCRSGWPPCSTSRHARHARHGRSAERGRAQQPGREVEREGRLADPVGADQQDGLGHRPPDHRGHRARARPACPRVRARSTTWSVRRVRPAPSSCASCAASARRRRRHRSRSPTSRDAFAAAGLRVRPRLGRSLGRSARGAVGRAGEAGIVRAGRPWPSAADAAADALGPLAAWPGPWPSPAAGLRVARGLAGALTGASPRLDRRSVGDHGRRVGRRCGRGTRAGRPADRPASGRPGPEASPRARAARRSTARSSCDRPAPAQAGRRRGCSCDRRAAASPDGSGRSRRDSG